MATNLHALIRYRTINKCLRDKDRNYNWKALAEACTEALLSSELSSSLKGKKNDFLISRRTIFKDIEHMKSGVLGYHAPIEYDHTVKGFYYTDSKFSIDHVPLKREDMDDLNNAMLILKQFSGNAKLGGLQSVISQLEQTLNIRPGRRREIIQFETSLNEAGHRWLNQVYDAIKNKQTINIDYHPFGKEKTTIIFSPYLLKEFNNRWFVIGKPHDNDHKEYSIITLGLDRFKKCVNSLHPFEESADFDSGTYLKDIIGVTLFKDKTKTEIIFTAFGIQGNYIETKPIHHSQKTIETTDVFKRFSIQVIPNPELEGLLLSFGERIRVDSPSEIVENLIERMDKARGYYKNS